MNVLDRVQFQLARRMCTSPALAARLLRVTPVSIDGPALDPGIRLMLHLRELRRMAPLETLPVRRARSREQREAALATGRPVRVGAVRDLTLPTSSGPLPARHYAPPRPEAAPLLVYLHGGGFVLCDLDSHDQACRMLCRYGGLHVLAIDYRLAPEYPHPAAVHDARDAFAWAVAHAEELRADPRRVGIGGDSAGGNLAAVTSQLSRGGGPVPALQLLIYPAIDLVGGYRSRELFADGFFLTAGEIAWFRQQYSPGIDPRNPLVSPIHAEDLSGLAPALLVTAGFDPLRDEGEAYAKALADAGTRVILRREPTLIHGFVNMADLVPAARTATIGIARQAGQLLREGQP
ncbi:MAG: alpha/beta hydrolase [Micromonosporaceae bacterium]|nr:alpha/beta hydrolase [Micromonosporaceae bacterium]